MEVASCSLPVVVAPVGVAPDLLEDYKWLLFSSEKELGDITNKLLEDEGLCREIGRKLREKVAERVEGVYGEIDLKTKTLPYM